MKPDDIADQIKRKVPIIVIVGGLFLTIIGWVIYQQFRIDVPERHIAVLTKKSGLDLDNNMEVAPDESYKGLQLKVMNEGRRYVNPLTWSWEIYPMVEIPEGKMGVRIRLYGDDLGYGHFVASKETDKGIIQDVLRPGRYPFNAIVKEKNQVLTQRTKKDYVEIIELHTPVTIPAGFRGVVTNLAGPIPENPNVLLVENGFRGVQKEALEPGTYYLNPYMYRIEAIDCRSQRFNLAENNDMGFPSKDGFWVSLDGIIEFRVDPKRAAEVYVTYNEVDNDQEAKAVDEEIIRKVIMPNARSFCRLRGSNSSGREFIGGETRTKFQTDFQSAMHTTCDRQGVEIIQALITRINPPAPIAQPVRAREVSAQQLKQYIQETLQAEQDAKLATEKALITQKKALVTAEKQSIELVAESNKEQGVKLQGANRDLDVAKEDILAAKDRAEAIMSEKMAEAKVIVFGNEAEAAGWKKSIDAFNGSGEKFAQFVLYHKLAPSYKSIMTNTADSPLMDVFKNFSNKSQPVGK